MSKDFLLSTLQGHNNFLNIDVIKQGLYQNFHYMIIGYLFILVGVLSLCAIPFILALRLCSRNSINFTRYRACFCIEGVVFALVYVVLILSTTSNLEVATYVDEALQYYPSLSRNIIDDIYTFGVVLRDQLNILKDDLCNVLNVIQQTLKELPFAVTAMTEQLLQPLILEGVNSLDRTRDTCQATVAESGLIVTQRSCSHSLMTSIADAEARLEGIKTSLFTVDQKIQRGEHLSSEEKQLLTEHITSVQKTSAMVFNIGREPNWNKIYQTLDITCNGSLPNIKNAFLLMKNKPQSIEKYIQNTTNEVFSNIYRIKTWSEETMANVNSTIEILLPCSFVDSLKNFTYQIDGILTSFDTRRTVINKWTFSGRALLLLLPGAHGVSVLCILSIACMLGGYELRNLARGREKSTAAQLLRVGMLLGILLMWLDLILAGLAYLSASMASMCCAPVLDSTIFTKFLDDPQIWQNRTWFDTILPNSVSKYPGIKVKQVLLNCAHNETIYTAMNMKEYWDVKREMKMNSATLPGSGIGKAVTTGLLSITYPDADIIDTVVEELEDAWQEMDLSFITGLLAEMRRFQDLNLTVSFPQKLEKKLENSTKYNFILQDLHFITNEIQIMNSRIIPQIVNNILKIVSMKENTYQIKTNVSNIKTYASDLRNMVKQTILPTVVKQVNQNVTITNTLVKNFVNRLDRSLMHETGNCHILYKVFKKTVWAFCDNGIFLLNGIWASLGMLGGAMLMTLISSCRIASYLRGSCRKVPAENIALTNI